MNTLTSEHRKLAYIIAIIVLLIPVIWLGMPSTGEDGSGGELAKLRVEHELGESTLGDVDPSSASMNFVLLGLRGIATNLLWMDANEHQKKKEWAKLRSTVDSIILLQPHYMKVWDFQGWNLAYNVSAEWDAVEDRYFWVKEGIKFLNEGVTRNERFPELDWKVGNLHGQKVGRSDEWRLFRKFYKVDPDTERFENGPDPEINPERLDNYQVAKEKFLFANEKELKHKQHLQMRMLFRASPWHAQFDYANAMQREGKFGTQRTDAWDQGFEDWTEIFGREEFITPKGSVVLEWSEPDIENLAKRDNVSKEDKRYWTGRYQNMVNYLFWRTRAKSESESDTIDAHKSLYDGEQLFLKAEFDGAKAELEKGMALYASVLNKYPSLMHEDLAIEEGLQAIILWRYIHELKGLKLPESFPLKSLWIKEQGRVPSLESDLRRRFGIQ
ncbi:MAG: hypothetical protein K0U86_23535 [Planctomycetes bacterium]|nr:hypothetical protein [Planctomycetota bacterium]MCH9727886.1 hypothetical protein [Planctomycetota bacterium]MCH9775446.1 hypothetical protein [Planctomycetota bacterium]